MIADPRHLANGLPIPSEGYIDQPYVVQTDDGAWLLATTTGAGREGAGGQHIISMRSRDQGRSWTEVIDVEPASGPEASYAVLLKTPYGRVYCFYNHNTDNVRAVKTEDGGEISRVDSLGHYVFKYSDDHGRRWSAERYTVPVRAFACDRENVYGGTLRFFWNVGRPLVRESDVFLTLHKVGAFGAGFFAQSAGCILHSPNILSERDPAAIVFHTLPDGEIGLRTPPGGGRIAEEQCLTALSDGSLFCVYRTIDGWPACSYSRDHGHTWTEPAYLTYGPGGRRVKHPRAANFVWRCDNGLYLYWFHHHGGAAAHGRPDWDPYNGRNPAWLMAGREVVTPAGRRLEWSQPEIVLYDDDPLIRISYPDLIERDGRFWITETQKTTGRVHAIPQPLLAGLFGQWEHDQVARAGLLLEYAGAAPAELPMPALPHFLARDCSREDMPGVNQYAGITVELWWRGASTAAGQVLCDTRDTEGRGVAVQTVADGAVEVILNDGQTENRWRSDHHRLIPGVPRHLAVVLDGGPRLILFIIDGRLDDGGDQREYGWGRFSPFLTSVNGAATMRLGAGAQALRLYGRALRVSEVVGNWRAGMASPPVGDP